MEWASSKKKETCFGRLPIKILRVAFWQVFLKFVVVRSFTADSNLLQPTGCVNRTPSHVTFSRICMHSFQCRTRHWLKMFVRITSCHHALEWLSFLISLRLSTLHSSPSLSSFSFSWSSSSMWVGSGRSTLCASANEELGTFGRQQSSHRLWAQLHRQLPDLRDHWNLHSGVLQRQQALKLAWIGDRWLHHRQSALFTTVHSGARRSSEP